MQKRFSINVMNDFDVGVQAATPTRATATNKTQKEGSKTVKSKG